MILIRDLTIKNGNYLLSNRNLIKCAGNSTTFQRDLDDKTFILVRIKILNTYFSPYKL